MILISLFFQKRSDKATKPLCWSIPSIKWQCNYPENLVMVEWVVDNGGRCASVAFLSLLLSSAQLHSVRVKHLEHGQVFICSLLALCSTTKMECSGGIQMLQSLGWRATTLLQRQATRDGRGLLFCSPPPQGNPVTDNVPFSLPPAGIAPPSLTWRALDRAITVQMAAGNSSPTYSNGSNRDCSSSSSSRAPAGFSDSLPLGSQPVFLPSCWRWVEGEEWTMGHRVY